MVRIARPAMSLELVTLIARPVNVIARTEAKYWIVCGSPADEAISDPAIQIASNLTESG